MTNFLIKNSDEAEAFANKLKSYWSYNTSLVYTKEIFKYYQIEENYPFIDNDLNNHRALCLALSDTKSDFLNLLLNSPKIKNKAYSLIDIGELLALGTSFPVENVKLIINAFEEKKEVFKDDNEKNKELFLGGLMNFLLSDNFWVSAENEKFFFDFVRRQDIRIYDNEHNVINGLLYYGNTKVLDSFINNAQNDTERLKIIRKDLASISMDRSTMEFMELKKQEYVYKQYESLDTELNINITNNKKNKLKI
jgi:hypothetical protein